MEKYRIIPLSFLLFLQFFKLTAQNEDVPVIVEEFVLQTMKDNNIEGSSITYFKRDRELLTKGFGSLEKSGAPVNPNTTFYIGSMTKSFTGFAILQLEEAGKLRLEDAVMKYLPEFRTKNKNLSDQITLLHLLNHNSGFTTLQGNRSQAKDYDEADALAKVVEDYSNVLLKYTPGSYFAYSNANYQILGLIIEQLTNTSYENYVYENILKPLRMDSSSFERTPFTVTPHRYFLGIPFSYKKPLTRNKVSQGGLYSSVKDMQKYLKAILIRDTTLVSELSYQKIFDSEQAGLIRYGFAGWDKLMVSADNRKLAAFRHTGSNPGTHSSMTIVPELEMGVVVLINTQGSLGFHTTSPLCYGPANIVLGQSPPTAPVYGKIIYLILWIINLVLLYLVYRGIRKPKKKSLKELIPFTIFALIACYLSLKFIPNFLGGAGFKTILRFEPEIAILLLGVSFLSISVAVIDIINYKRTTSNTV